MLTIAGRMASIGNRPSGFDYLRVILAVSIVAFHTVVVCYGDEVNDAWWSIWWFRMAQSFPVPSFFALSGFLVAGSIERNSIPAFIALRVMRIAPALAVEVFISALVIGASVTILPLKDYFSDPEFRRYFLNIVGNIHFTLPGVFADLPNSKVNLQLWTVPYELECYIAIVVLALIGFVKRPALLLSAALALGVFSAAHMFRNAVAADLGVLQRDALVTCFLLGVAFYLLRTKIPYHVGLFAASIAIFPVAFYFPKFDILSLVPITYITVYLGLTNPAKTIIVRNADYSYGVYLYGYPVQQLVVYLFPDFRNPAFNFVVSLPVICAFAMASWRLIESKVIERKNIVLHVISRLGRPAEA